MPDERQRFERLFGIADDIIANDYDLLPAAVWPRDDGTLAKAPLLKHGHLDAHRDPQLIREQLIDPPHVPKLVPEEFEVVVGYIPGSGNCGVLDADVKHGSVGTRTLQQLIAEHGNFVGAAWRSASGGINVLFRKPPDAAYGNASPWAGIDVRVDNGWVVAPGNEAAGKKWEWIGAGRFANALLLPEAMSAQLKPAGYRNERATNAETVAFIEASPETSSYEAMRAFGVELERFRQAGQGNRHEALVKIIGWAWGMTHLDLRWALEQIKDAWQVLTAGESRGDEVDDVAAWATGQEAPKRAAAAAITTTTTGGSGSSEKIGNYQNLPEEFWTARPLLTELRAWAHSRLQSGDSVYAAMRARFNVLVPYTYRIDTGFASPMSLNSLIAIVAPSGGGKSTSAALGAELVPLVQRKDVYEAPPGSGEGIVESFFEWVPDPNHTGNGPPPKVKQQVYSAVLLDLDEGQGMLAMAQRSGATLAETVRSAWSGTRLGQKNATADRTRILAPHTYRLTMLVGFQPEISAQLLADIATGTPQRFVMFNATDPTIEPPEVAPPAPKLPPPPPQIAGSYITLEPVVQQEMRDQALAVRRNELKLSPLDAHRNQNRAVEAAMLAVLDGRTIISEEDWKLAGLVMDTSDALRAAVAAVKRQADVQAQEARGAAQAVTETSRERRLIATLSGRIDAAVAAAGPRVLTERKLERLLTSMTTRHRLHPALELSFANCTVERDDDGFVNPAQAGKTGNGSPPPGV